MKLVRVSDNTRRPQRDFREIQTLISKVANKNLTQLEREGLFVFPSTLKQSEDLQTSQQLLRSEEQSYRTSNVMGFVGWQEEKLIISSRFAGEESDYFFTYLLQRVLRLPNLVELLTDSQDDAQLYDFLLFMFPYCLKRALRKGLFRLYRRTANNDCNPKGTINVVRHIALNTPFMGKIAYDQHEYVADNALLQLVRHTIEHIRANPHGAHLLAGVKDEVKTVIEATPSYRMGHRQRVVEQNRRSRMHHAFYREYFDLQRLCLQILRYERHSFFSGPQQFFGLLFDGSWLWEEYINLLVGAEFYHPQNRSAKGAQYLFEGAVGLIYPDFIGRDPHCHVIADAKYKPKHKISNRDYLQLLAYMLRFEAERGYYFYPEQCGATRQELKLLRGTQFDSDLPADGLSGASRAASERSQLPVIKQGLAIPTQASDYATFVAQMQQSEREFIASVLSS